MELTHSERKSTVWFFVIFSIACIAALMILTSCVAQNAQAEADVYNVLAPAHKRYVETDQSMSDMEKQTRLSLIEAWKKRIVAQGGTVR